MDTKADIKLSFTTAERALVRDALLQYMEEHSIGVPMLYNRIHRNDPLKREMSSKTLQRFLAHANQTQNSNVSMCFEFVKQLPYFSEQNKIRNLGGALAGLFPYDNERANPFWEGTSDKNFDVRFVDEGAVAQQDHRSRFSDLLPYSTVLVRRVDASLCFHCVELVFNAFADPYRPDSPRYFAEGAAIPSGDRSLLAVTHDKLTRSPRSALWSADEDMRQSSINLSFQPLLRDGSHLADRPWSLQLTAQPVDTLSPVQLTSDVICE